MLASIVEKETGIAAERAKIAGVFVNRMRRGMRLQTDPTVIYGIGISYDGNIRKRDLLKKTLYNTYKIDGLPPTPIALPSKEAIHAVMHPEKTKALYFVAKGGGEHYFSNNLVEHNRAVRKYLLNK
ncbi:FIG004453: protein YceG like [hydrothermal vent metagenome]|uniref:FIG004453: protein YceG like n=1 Tax=hydrothermal vent metagenome TaxID=652676 RepID=A0A3B0VLB7_9ZZZZ